MDMIGVMPEPAERNRCFSAGWKLVLKSPYGPSAWSRSPTATASWRWFDTGPPATRLTVMVNVFVPNGAEEIEQHRSRPSSGTRMVTYWPGSKSTQVIQAARSSKVFTSWVTSVMATTSTSPVSRSEWADAVGTPVGSWRATDLGCVPRPGTRNVDLAAGCASATGAASSVGRFERRYLIADSLSPRVGRIPVGLEPFDAPGAELIDVPFGGSVQPRLVGRRGHPRLREFAEVRILLVRLDPHGREVLEVVVDPLLGVGGHEPRGAHQGLIRGQREQTEGHDVVAHRMEPRVRLHVQRCPTEDEGVEIPEELRRGGRAVHRVRLTLAVEGGALDPEPGGPSAELFDEGIGQTVAFAVRMQLLLGSEEPLVGRLQAFRDLLGCVTVGGEE